MGPTKTFTFWLFTAEHFVIFVFKFFFFTFLHYLWLHQSQLLWRFFCFLFSHPLFISFSSVTVCLQRCILLFQIPIKWLLTRQPSNFSHQEDICYRVEELVLTQFLLIYYLSSQVLPQTFITLASRRLGYDTRLFFRKVLARIITLGSHPPWKYNLGEILNSAGSEW